MNWPLNTSFAQDIGMTLVHSLWQILLIAAAFAVINRMLVRQSANVRYVVAYCALLLMLILPLGTLCFVSTHSMHHQDSAAKVLPPFDKDIPFDSAQEEGTTYPVTDVAVTQTALSIEPIGLGNDSQVVMAGDPVAIEQETSAKWDLVLPWLSVVWSLGVMAFSVRPCIALYRCRQLRKHAKPIDEPWITDTLASLCTRIGLNRTVDVASSVLVRVPTVMGFIRPVILLPLAMISGQTPDELSAIIAHELAHVRRHDFLLNLFQTAIETLLFYHPALWWVSSVVRQERENCCDDIAMSVCGRKNYATALANLEFARSSETSLAMAADGGSLYRRIRRIVRPHENPSPLGRCLAALIASATLLVGIVAMMPRNSVAATEENTSEEVEANPETPLSERFPHDVIEISGQVVSPTGKPVANARIHALRWHWNDPLNQRPLASTISKPDGGFSISYRKSQLHSDVGKAEQWKQTWFVATADGFGLGLLDLKDVHPEKTTKVELVEDQLVSGRIVDLEGRPVANAVVRPVRLDIATDGSIDGFVESVREGANVPQAFIKNLHAMYQVTCVPELANTRTDVEGKFQISGLGKNRVAYVRCSGENIATTEFASVTKPLSRPYPVAENLAPNATGILFGTEASITVAPTQIISGTVIDAQTHEPVEGVKVLSGRGRTQCQAKTDKDGIYQLIGLPKRKSSRIVFVAPSELQYFNRTEQVTEVPGLHEAQLDVELFHGEWLSGKVIDEQGEGVFARVHYLPYKDNPHAQRNGQFRQGPKNEYYQETNLDGSYRVLAIPGHAILGARAMDKIDYRAGVGHNKLTGYDPDDDLSPSLMLYGILGGKSLHAIQELDPDTSHEGKEYNLQLQEQASDADPDVAVGTVLDPDREADVHAEQKVFGQQNSLQMMTEVDGTEKLAANTAASNRKSYAGQVLLPNGEPADDADIYLIHPFQTLLKKVSPKPLARTNRDGRFQFTLERDPSGEAASGTVVAKLDGYAFAWAAAAALDQSGNTEKWLADAPAAQREMIRRDQQSPMRLLTDDAPISGRVVDAEGNGVEGVRAYATEVYGAPDNTMAAWDRVIGGKAPDFMKLQSALTRVLRGSYVPNLLGETKSDQDGHFTIHGVGRHRIVKIAIRGTGMVDESFYMRTSGGERVDLPMMAGEHGPAFRSTYHGKSFTHVAEPSRPVVGRVTDEAGKGISGVFVSSMRTFSHGMEAGKPTSVKIGSDNGFAITDADGRYRFEGLPISRDNTLRFDGPVSSAFLSASKNVDTQTSKDIRQRYAPVTKDFKLKDGLIVEGRVTDAKTGEGVRGDFRFLRKSETGGMFASFAGARRLRSQADGKFQFTIPKTAGNLTFNASGIHKYRNVQQADAKTAGDDGAVRVEVRGGELMMFGTAALLESNAIHEITGTESGPLRLELKVEPAPVITGHAIGPSGKRLSNITYLAQWWSRSTTGELKLYDFDAKQPTRLVMALQREKKLAGMRRLEALEDGFQLKLQRWATVRGRILNEDGEPLAGAYIFSDPGQPPQTVSTPDETMTFQARANPLPPPDGSVNSQHVTDDEGRFKIEGLVAGATYHLRGQYIEGVYEQRANIFARDLKLRPGEDRNLNEIVLKKPEPSKPGTVRPPVAIGSVSGTSVPHNLLGSTEAKQGVPNMLTYSGTVKNVGGSPAHGSHVAVIATELDGQFWREAKALAETTTDAAGRFLIRLEGVSEKTHANAHLVMRTETSGIAWKKVELKQIDQASATNVVEVGETKLLPSDSIQCRLIDLEGQPAKNLEVQVSAIVVPVKGEQSEWLRFFRLKQPPKAWVRTLRTDEDGLLNITNITRGHGVYLSVLATDEFAPQNIALNTGMSEKRGERDGTYRSIVKNSQPGEVPLIPLSPATIFEGVVRLEDTGEPAANCKIEIWARQENSGSMMSVFGKTDNLGRFRLNPHPGVRFGITAYPPDGTPYQIKRFGDLGEGIRWTSGDESKNITIELTRGAIATGRIVDAISGVPIANASVQYRPTATNPNDSDGVITGWQGIKKTNSQGDFRISVLPGEGWLLVHTNNRDYVLQQKTGRQLAYDKPGGMRIYAHAFVKINPTRGEANVAPVKLIPAETVTLEVVDPEGDPVTEGLAISRLHVRVHAGWWRGQSPDVIKDGIVEIGGVGAGVDYPIYLLDPKRKLGAVATINALRPTQKIVLKPCGSAVASYVDQQDRPLAGKGMAFHMVVTPGVNQFDLDAMRNEGAVAADRDFVSNIDRLNHWGNLSGDDGKLVISALIPGATYRHASGQPDKLNEFVAKSGEVRDLGRVVIDEDDSDD